MTDLDLHHEFDRLDTGLSDHPDLAGLWAGGQRRRRRTRAIWTATGLATAAVVAPLALLVGGGADTAPTTPGFASEPTAIPSPAEPAAATNDDERAFDAMRAAAFDAFPPADDTYVASSGVNAYNEPIDGEGLYWLTEAGVRLTFYAFASGERLPCPADGCEQVGDRNVVVVDEGPVEIEGDQGKWIRTVQVFPTDPARTDMLEVSAAVSATSREEADAKLPSLETMTALALDERLEPAAE